jgi:LysM repeat protein
MTLAHLALLAATSLGATTVAAPALSDSSFRIGSIAEGTAFHDSHSHENYHDHHEKRGNDAYMMYIGNGQTAWPEKGTWVSSFDEMFTENNDIMKGGCIQFNVASNSDQEVADISAGINQVSSETGIDARFIFAIMLQESNGCVRAPTTNYGVRNPGLMQDHDGTATCNEGGNVQNPCPAEVITQMIRDGAAGTAAGDGLKQTLSQAPGNGAGKYYGAARIYNSGSIAASGDLGSGIATHCYASDIANRLTGWVFAQQACTLDGAPAPAAAQAPASLAPDSSASTPISSPVVAAPVDDSPPAPVDDVPSAPFEAPSAPSHGSSTTATRATSNNMAPGVATECSQYYTIQDGDLCFSVAEEFGTTFDNLRTLNTQLDGVCSNLWKGYDYCVKGV